MKTIDIPDKDLLGVFKKKTDVMIIDGKVYNVSLNRSLGSIEKFLDDRDQQAATILKKRIDEVRLKENEILEKNKNVMTMPKISELDCIHGLQVFTEGGKLWYVVPFHYNPKQVEEDDILYDMCKRHISELENDIFMLTLVGSDGWVFECKLSKIDGGKYREFEHYHFRCFGDLELGKVTCTKDIFELRDKIEKLFSVINYEDVWTEGGEWDNLPEIADLIDNAVKKHKVGEGGGVLGSTHLKNISDLKKKQDKMSEIKKKPAVRKKKTDLDFMLVPVPAHRPVHRPSARRRIGSYA